MIKIIMVLVHTYANAGKIINLYNMTETDFSSFLVKN